ncbi:TorF family putative porin [Sphingobium sp.]|uniref:TorF family putative porin n=1 Tax=Sphingobium sp. TaxID=1912891 RepID=UPI0028BEA2F7|nr:TorF family putative porin [Sphingobium sp.]
MNAARSSACRAAFAAMFLAAGLTAFPAAAQWGGSLTLSSQARLRGQPVSDHRPVVALELVHDDPGGFYLGGSASVVASGDSGLQPLAFIQYAGFARRLPHGLVMDMGIVHGGYTEYSEIAEGGSYTEAYVGLIGPHLSGHLFLSPAYFHHDRPTLYAELEGHVDIARNTSLFAHAGLLAQLRGGADPTRGNVVDWRIGMRRRFGRIDAEAAWTGFTEDKGGYARRDRKNGALVLAIAYAF